MPLAARAIEPEYLGRRPLREEEQGEGVVQVAVTHNAVLGALVQLSSLVRHADDLFCDLADECQKVFEHTERIIHQVKRIKERVGQLDSKAVTIPLGDLKQFSAVQDHHVARHGFQCHLFTPEVRPHFVQCRYALCDVTPVRVLRGADPYRKDGLHSSDLFKLWPVILREHQPRSPDLSLYRKQGKAMTFSKKYKRLKARSRTLPNGDSVALFHQARAQDQDQDSSSVAFVDAALSKSQPSILVAVDTSGSGFRKMTSFRRSLKGTQSLDRNSSRRRRTVSGVPDGIMQEIEVFERGRRTTRSTPRNYSFDDLDSMRREPADAAGLGEKGDDHNDDEMMKQLMNDMDAKMEEKAEERRASRDAKLLKFLPCKRSRSLPRCLKLKEGRRGGLTFEGENSKDKPLNTAATAGFASSLSLGSTGAASTAASSSGRSTRRSSIISSKIKSFVTGTLRPRPKSLDFDTVDILSNDDEEDDDNDDNGGNARRQKLDRVHSPSMPDNISSLASSRESSVGPGTYYYFNSSTLPRTQARKYDFPWESLPKDWTTSVRLRQISKRRKEERNSSSGNWSGSSNRQSLDSEQSSATAYTSRQSLGRDSGRDSFGDDRDDVQGELGVSSFQPDSATMDTDQWLASLAQRAAAREDAMAGGSHVTQSLTRLSELTRQNIQALDDTFSPHKALQDDELSSVYSLDQDGFYTSFHTDSGLRRSTGTLIDEEEGADDEDVDGDDGDGDEVWVGGDLTPSKENNNDNSFLSSESGHTADSVIFCPMGVIKPGKAADVKSSSSGGKVRPKPPVRSSSRLSSNSSISSRLSSISNSRDAGGEDGSNKEGGEGADVVRSPTDSEVFGELSPSDSDQETVSARLRVKTQISPRVIPSWCLVSDEDTSPDADGDAHQAAKDLSWDLDSLPQRYLESKVWEEDLADTSNSWPRSRRGGLQPPTTGILKRDKSPSGSLKPKTLNFAPVVSMFDPLTSHGTEMPLNAASSASSSSSDTSTAGLAFTLARGAPAPHGRLSRSMGDVKHAPSTSTSTSISARSSKPRHSAGPRVPQGQTTATNIATSTPLSQARRQPAALAVDRSELSACSSESSLFSELDSWHSSSGSRDYSQHSSSQATLSSSSSAGLSDIDSSLTYVSMSGSNSTLVLEAADDLPTPVNSPRTARDGNFPAFQVDDDKLPPPPPHRVPECHSSASTPYHPPLPVDERSSGGGVTTTATATAGTPCMEAAPVSGSRDPTSVMMSSADSGFSSTSAVCVIDSAPPKQHRERHQHRQPQSSNDDRLTDLKHGPGSDSSSSVCVDGVAIHGSDKRQRSAGHSRHKHHADHKQREGPRTRQSQGDSTQQQQQQTPRSDSYRAANMDFSPLSLGPRDNRHGSRDSLSSRDSVSSSSRDKDNTSLSSRETAYSSRDNASHNSSRDGAYSARDNTTKNNAYRDNPHRDNALHSSRDSLSSRDSVSSNRRDNTSHSSRHTVHRDNHTAHNIINNATPLNHRSRASNHAAFPSGPQPSNRHTYSGRPPAYPNAAMVDADGVPRADSYRIAVRNTQGVVGEMATRNTSYRMARGDEDHAPVLDPRMEAINAWDRRQSMGGGRDIRRVGITDIDQLKSYDSDSSTSRGSTSSSSLPAKAKAQSAAAFASIRSSHKKMTPEVENLLRADKTPSPEVKLRTPRSSSSSSKDKEKEKRRSSTYMRFDSIFEKGDDLYSSSNTLRAESVEMIYSEDGLLMGDKVVGQLPPGRFRPSGGRKGGPEDKDKTSSSSILGSIKTTLKSMSGGKSADKYDGLS